MEDDTKILLSKPTQFGEYDVLYQKWFWDGITAESLIFLTDDLKNTTDERIHFEKWCPDLESNQGHKDFQSFALPTELSGLYLKLAIKPLDVVKVKYSFYFFIISNPVVFPIKALSPILSN